jgi:alpha-glucosidase
MKKLLLISATIITTLGAMGQSNLSNSLGNATEIAKESQRILIKTTNGNAQIRFYSPTAIRIQITKQASFDEFSYAVIAKPVDGIFKVTETPVALTLTTDSCKLVVTKSPVRFSLQTLNGTVLNEDENAFGTNWIGEEITTYKKMQEDEKFIGLGEKTGNLNRRGEGYTNWNTDFFAYPSGGDPIYATIPFYIGLHHQKVYGLFMDNTFKSHFNFGASNNRFSSFTAESGEMNYYLFANTSVAGIIKSYSDLTGRMEMPSLWSIGFQQCRYSYYPDKEVITLAKTFRDKKIPADVIYFDIHYMDKYKIFTWDNNRFPQPKKMLDELEGMGFKNVVIVDPGIKVEDKYKAYEEGKAQDLFIKYPDGTNYTGQVWPGWCHFPDFTKPKTREWWGNSFSGYINDGIDGFWNDMNEPATWGQRFPDLVEADYEGRKATHREWHNVYGFQMARSTFEGSKKLLNGRRPFILTRAAYSGIQRYSAIWTGDNRPEDDHMMAGVRLVNSLGLSGVANAGYDVGGFAGEASKELFSRWMQIGTFCPFFRSHKMVDAKDSEPWSYGEKVEEIVRNYISLRYKLMPYLYGTFYESTQNGMPVARSLAIDYTFDNKIYDWNYQNQYLFGHAIMVAPVVSYKEINKVYLPQGTWYNLHTEQVYNGKQELYVETPMETLPLYIKGSSIIPMQSVVQSAKEMPVDTLYLHVYKGNEANQFVYYEDAGDGYEHLGNKYHKRTFTYQAANNTLVLGKTEGAYVSKFKAIKLMMHGFDGATFKANGVVQNSNVESVEMIAGVSQFDPIGKSIESKKATVVAFTIKNTNDQMIINW